MTIVSPDFRPNQGNAGEMSSDSSRNKYADLMDEAQPEIRDQLGVRQYANLAGQIRRTREYYATKNVSDGDATEGLQDLYVEEEIDPRLKDFAAVVVGASEQAQNQTWLEDHKAIPNLTPFDKNEMVRRLHETIDYSHTLRTVALDVRDIMGRQELTTLLNEGMSPDDGVRAFMQSELDGVTGEIALRDVLETMPEFADVEFTDVDRDAAGSDIEAQYRGRPVDFDAKFNKNIAPKVGQTQVGRELRTHITITVGRENIQELGASPEGTERLTAQIRNLMDQRVAA